MKTKLLMIALLGFGITACTNPMSSMVSHTSKPVSTKNLSYNTAPAAKVEAFDIKKREVGLSTKNDPKYHSFGPELKTDAMKNWFNDLMYRLWDRQITKRQFVTEGVSQFPAHQYEFNYIANGF